MTDLLFDQEIDAQDGEDFCTLWHSFERAVSARENISFNYDECPYNVGEKIALVHSELSEALEAFRKDLMDDHIPDRPGIEVEFADAVIRLMGIAVKLKLRVPEAMIAKARYNETRADHKPENRSKEHGKRF